MLILLFLNGSAQFHLDSTKHMYIKTLDYFHYFLITKRKKNWYDQIYYLRTRNTKLSGILMFKKPVGSLTETRNEYPPSKRESTDLKKSWSSFHMF